MKRWNIATVRLIVLGAVVAVGAASAAINATTVQQGDMVVEVERLQDNLYVLRGGGGTSSPAMALC